MNKFKILISLSILLSNFKSIFSQNKVSDVHLQNDEQINDTLLYVLRANSVTDENYYRNVLYTWTTNRQIQKIQNGGKILQKSSGINELSFYEHAINSKSLKNQQLAKILRENQFNKKRFSWINAWSTCNGEKDYGNYLLKIKLKDSALICRINPFKPESTQVIDNKGNVIEESDYELIKERIAAVYYVNHQNKKGRFKKVRVKSNNKTMYYKKFKYKIPVEQSFYREYVIINEYMIDKVEYNSIALTNDLENEISLLQSLLNRFKDSLNETNFHPIPWNREKAWSDKYFHENLLPSLYFYSIAFPGDKYEFNQENIQELISILQNKLRIIRDANKAIED